MCVNACQRTREVRTAERRKHVCKRWDSMFKNQVQDEAERTVIYKRGTLSSLISALVVNCTLDPATLHVYFSL